MEERWHRGQLKGFGGALDILGPLTTVCYYYLKWDLTSHCCKASKEARLVGRKVCFWRLATLRGGLTCVQRLAPHHWQSGGKSVYRRREGAACRPSTVSSASHPAVGHRWSGQCHLDWLGTVDLQFQGQFVPISLRPVLKLVAIYVMAIVWSLGS